ncbi:mannosyltransferase [Rhodococcus sp. BP-349]|uniref:mannosyltransferase n=1 Tax=unclassified Rhodococcus (in: high G+C Gram-positive bacteria) TaxID=192944 RepID=UPI001C9ADA9A|nr:MULTISPECIES: mannosyltransferase [unclassified Rhodococcus (in: high G+C Gram-positive bacteria)]MBY6538626.1 mannosyltransferase [Rhodococcus sp. BP-363]MBY6542963.1 mannosyltransferase [Rhodococcus sp. BP-369]MBY6562193.1 mannosyltransferase [Rhodococcus sp. BP-370]MBY6576485.1 mannosyltransferase [Rhodococcus sp. BP-364]MBY6585786.1 mannosyltransferase [Rhodococcus sp. BP-358]
MSEVQRSAGRAVLAAAPALFVLSLILRVVWTVATPNGSNWVDLHVYVDGSARLFSGDLYDFTYSEETPDFPLPFTYPPFAALVFYPLHFLPFPVVGAGWMIATIAALYAVVRLAQGMVGTGPWSGRRAAVLWTTVGLWTESMRTTLDYGQVNVFLVLLAMLAARSARWWLSGALVGVAAGVKLTPAITGLYFLAQRRWAAAAFSAVAFAATVVVSFLLVGPAATTYFTTLLGDADRIGPVGSVWNQSLRGALSRVAGQDVGQGPVWLVAAAVVLAAAFLAWRTLARDDRLGTLVIVSFVGLMISPISWSHHWVWVVPMLIWLMHGPLSGAPGARVLAGYWLVVTLIGVPWILSFEQPSIWDISRPWPLALAGSVYAVGTLALFVWIAVVGRRVTSQGGRSRLPAARPSR